MAFTDGEAVTIQRFEVFMTEARLGKRFYGGGTREVGRGRWLDEAGCSEEE